MIPAKEEEEILKRKARSWNVDILLHNTLQFRQIVPSEPLSVYTFCGAKINKMCRLNADKISHTNSYVSTAIYSHFEMLCKRTLTQKILFIYFISHENAKGSAYFT